MKLTEKDEYIEKYLMLLSAETLRFMVADLHFESESYKRNLADTVIVPGEQYDKLVAENEELKQLEKQYANALGRLAQLCDTVCAYVLATTNPHDDTTIYQCADEIMEYVNSVRP